jgi:rhodanese-related sulfurtransferase
MQDVVYFINHNLFLTAAWVIVIVLLAVIELRSKIYGPKRLATTELIQWLNQSNAILYDLRAAADFNKGHIAQSINYPFSDINNLNLLLKKIAHEQKDQGRPVILVCKDGTKSHKEGFNLKNNSIKEVGYLQGGMMTWQSENLPTVSS